MPLAVRASLPDNATARPPIILVHGAANSAGVWIFWQDELARAGVASYALDLRGHGSSAACDLSRTSMQDYADDLEMLAAQLHPRPVLMGWSMGGLVAMLVAARGKSAACIGLAPSTPALVGDPTRHLRAGVFGAEEYGIVDPNAEEQPSMPDLDPEERTAAIASLGLESRWARDERAAGVVIPSLPCPLLIVTGSEDAQWPRNRYVGLHLPAHHMEAPDASHWGLVLSRPAIRALLPHVLDWLAAAAP